MKRFAYLLLVTASLSSCKKDTDPAADSGLIGTWRLVNRQCYCALISLPIENLTFNASTYAFSRSTPNPSSLLFTNGTYQAAAVSLCGLPTPGAGLRLTDANANIGPRDVRFTIQADTLVLDYGSPCDAPLDTYVRTQP